MQYGVKGRDAKLRWYIFGFPKPDFSFAFNNTTIEMAGRFSCSYNNAGELTLVINRLVGTQAKKQRKFYGKTGIAYFITS